MLSKHWMLSIDLANYHKNDSVGVSARDNGKVYTCSE